MYILPLLLTVFIDSLGFGLVFPIFSPMIVNNEGALFSMESTVALRGFVFGLLASTYCLGQLIGGPVLGGLSDRVGRKKVLVGSLWMAVLGYLFAGVGVILQSLTLLFISRLGIGFSAGSFPVAQSVIADVSTRENKTKNLGLVGMACWTGFVIGPFLGGKLAVYGFTVPFICAAALCLFIALLLLFRMRETLPTNPQAKIQWWKGARQLRAAFAIPELRGLFTVMFVFCLGWGFFTEFSPIFLNRRLGFDVEQIANFYAWVGLWIALCQGLLIRPLLKKFLPRRLLAFGLLFLGLSLPLMLGFRHMSALLWVVPPIAFSQALVFPTVATLVSNLASEGNQGELLGLNHSIQWTAIALPPLFSGSFVALFPHLPVSVGSSCMLLAFVLLLRNSRQKCRENNLE
jgi:MFS transporter, DHA1 family, tetracycline resistance protein